MTSPGSSWKIAKTKEAGPGTYDDLKAYDTTQRRKVGVAKPTEKRQSFVDTIAKQHKYKPGVGKYKEIDRGLKLVGRETLATAKEASGKI